jgi:hypothetical protein
VFFDADHPEIELNLRFRDYLKTHSDVRDAYASTKMKILLDKTSHEKTGKFSFPIYTLRKKIFIDAVIERMGFYRLRVLKCTTEGEQNAIKNFCQHSGSGGENFDPTIFDHRDHEHFLLYLGAKIVGYAHIELYRVPGIAALRAMEISEENFQSPFLAVVEKWLKVHSYVRDDSYETG